MPVEPVATEPTAAVSGIDAVTDFAQLARGTPARGRALDRIVASGAISAGQARDIIVDERVTEEAWSFSRM
jgi:hypothetical protein